jgi:hypothetical protein
MENAKYGKMRQVTALNGSKMVVKIGVVYYRRMKGKIGRQTGSCRDDYKSIFMQ